MTLAQIIAQILNPGLALLPISMDSTKARVMLLAIGLQESEFTHRAQVLNGGGKGPARGFWQFERGGGVKGIMGHHATTGHAHRICAERDVAWDPAVVWAKLETDDLLACCFARLLLFSDPHALPAVDDVIDIDAPEDSASWRYYVNNWRPGKPHPEKWKANHEAARRALGV